MRRTIINIVCVLAFVAAFALAGRAAGKAYQFTGTVKSVAGDALTVEKNAKETWQFEVPKDVKGGTPKVGDKVTVYYKMVATEIEASAAAPAKTSAKASAKKKK